jgi:signal transduction histidine kinase
MKFSRTVVQTAIDKAEAVLTTDAQGDPRFAQKESIVGMALRSIMCAPLMSRDKVIGVIYVDNRAKTAMFDRDDLDMLNAFASQAAAAIQNARLYEDTDRSLADRLEELENLAQASREMNMQDSMEGVLAVAREWALKSTGAAGAWIAIYQTENGERSVRVLAGPASGERMAEDDPVLAKVMAANTPHIFGPEGEQPARVAVPILVEEKSVGVMVLENEKPFSVEALHFASRLANQAMIAIEKAKLAERIDDAKMEKAQFVSVVAHELRIPMTSIQGYTDLLKQGAIGPVNEQQLEFLSVIRNNVGRMSMLVSDLSDIYKVESGRLLVEPIALPMRGMVERAIEGLQAHIDGKNQTVENQVAEELPKVFGDPKRVEQVLVNLLRNASMYSREGAKIEVAARLDGDFIVTRVTDQGYGLSAEEQLEIFSQFFRSERTEVREQLGWGLGLSLVKNLVALMGGEAGFESVLDKGSTFWFSLPVAS